MNIITALNSLFLLFAPVNTAEVETKPVDFRVEVYPYGSYYSYPPCPYGYRRGYRYGYGPYCYYGYGYGRRYYGPRFYYGPRYYYKGKRYYGGKRRFRGGHRGGRRRGGGRRR